jgi:hypothetical protein
VADDAGPGSRWRPTDPGFVPYDADHPVDLLWVWSVGMSGKRKGVVVGWLAQVWY